MLRFRIDCNPPKSTGQAGLRIIRKKDGTQFIGKFAKSKSKKAQNELMLLLSSHRPKEAFDGPIEVSIVWQYPWRKSEPKKNKIPGYKYCDTRPDADNLCKMLFDSMTRLNFWNDDSQIASLHFKKIWGNSPGIDITINKCISLVPLTNANERMEEFLPF